MKYEKCKTCICRDCIADYAHIVGAPRSMSARCQQKQCDDCNGNSNLEWDYLNNGNCSEYVKEEIDEKH